MLRESAMITSDDKPAFEDIAKHQFFNTNNLWVNLEALQARSPRCLVQKCPLGASCRKTKRRP